MNLNKPLALTCRLTYCEARSVTSARAAIDTSCLILQRLMAAEEGGASVASGKGKEEEFVLLEGAQGVNKLDKAKLKELTVRIGLPF